jgi:membrane-bound lytic murein transglycosylase A
MPFHSLKLFGATVARATAMVLAGLLAVALDATAQTTPGSSSLLPAPAACPPAPECRCPVCPTHPIGVEPAAVEYKGRLVPARFADLSGWAEDDPRPALKAFLRSCEALRQQASWQAVCTAAAAVSPKATRTGVQQFFERQFDVWQTRDARDRETGTITGYYEPLLMGSRKRSERFRFPIYRAPEDLITIDLSSALADLKHKRLRGRLVGNKVVPYLERADIESDKTPLAGLELVWVEDIVELYFLHIQGSGRVQLAEGGIMRVGYADQNGHPFRSLAGHLIRARELRPYQASMQGIKAWALAHPKKLRGYMNMNPSFIFFKELDSNDLGPIGTLGVPLTDERSLAVDPRVVPLGPPVFLSTVMPGTRTPLNRLMVAQDTGGAIAGGVRADFFWGFGDSAGEIAGRMKQEGKMWVLLPKGYQPEQARPAP